MLESNSVRGFMLK